MPIVAVLNETEDYQRVSSVQNANARPFCKGLGNKRVGLMTVNCRMQHQRVNADQIQVLLNTVVDRTVWVYATDETIKNAF